MCFIRFIKQLIKELHEPTEEEKQAEYRKIYNECHSDWDYILPWDKPCDCSDCPYHGFCEKEQYWNR